MDLLTGRMEAWTVHLLGPSPSEMSWSWRHGFCTSGCGNLARAVSHAPGDRHEAISVDEGEVTELLVLLTKKTHCQR